MSEETKPGRPSKFDEKYTQMLIDYFDIEPYREVEKKIATKQGDVIEIPEERANDFPTLAGFAVKIGVHRDTLHTWSESGQYPSFSDAYKRAKDFQENFLVTNGLKGLVNPAFAIFTAKNVLKWRDKQPDEIDTIIHNNVNQRSDEELDAIIAEKMKKLEGGE